MKILLLCLNAFETIEFSSFVDVMGWAHEKTDIPLLGKPCLALNDKIPHLKRISTISIYSRIPFEVAVDPFYSQENMTRLKESAAQMEATGGELMRK